LEEIDEEGAKIKEFDKMFHRSPTLPNNSYIEKHCESYIYYHTRDEIRHGKKKRLYEFKQRGDSRAPILVYFY